MSCQPRWPHSSRCAIAALMSAKARRHDRGEAPRSFSAAATSRSDGSSAPRRASAGTATALSVLSPTSAATGRAGAGLRGTGRSSPRLPEPPAAAPPPAGSPRRICSSCTRAAICWATSAVWMPWKRPSSQPDELGLRDPQLAVGGGVVAVERRDDAGELLAQLRRERRLELGEARRVDLLEPPAAGVVELGGPDLLQQLLDHRADPHHLRRLLDGAGDVLAALVGLVRPRQTSRRRHPHGARPACRPARRS